MDDAGGGCGLALKFSESFLSVQYRMQRKDGTYCGGPMVTLTRAFPGERLAKMLAVFLPEAPCWYLSEWAI